MYQYDKKLSSIVIMDDDMDLTFLLKKYFESIGHEVYLIENYNSIMMNWKI